MTMNSFLQKYRPVFAPDAPSTPSTPNGGGTENSGSSSSSSPSSAPSTPSAPSSPASSSPASSPSSPSSAPPSAPPSVSGGSGTSPSAAPAGSPPSPAPSAGEALDFESIFSGADGLPPSPPSPPATTPPTPPAQQPTPPAATPPVAAEATPPQPTQVTPPAQAGEPAATVQPQAQPTAPTLDRHDPGQLAAHLRENQAQAIDYVAENVFKLSPQEIEALETDVVGTVPKLLAKAYVMAQQNVLTQLASLVPVMIQRQSVAMKRHSENEDKFYSRWPDIKRDAHGDLVTRYGAVYRQMHPNATLEQMVEDLGPVVMMAAKIAPRPGQSATPGQPVVPATNGSAGRSPPPSPFVPAGAGPVSTSSAPELAPWEAMFQQAE